MLALVTGELAVARATPEAYRELARARIFPAEQCPVPPALANGRLYCRTGAGRVTCLDVAE